MTFARGRPVTGNAELVERAAALAGLAQRPAMSPRTRARCWGCPITVADNPVLAEVVRSGFIESGTAARSSRWPPTAASLLSAGAVDVPIFPRSSNKPMQAAAMVRCGLDLERQSCWRSPRPATPARTSTSPACGEILAGAGLTEDALQCPPGPAAGRGRAAGHDPGRRRARPGAHELLAASTRRCSPPAWRPAGRRRPTAIPDHPLQVAIRDAVSRAGRRAGGRDRRGRVRRAAAGDLGDSAWPARSARWSRPSRHARAQGRRRHAGLPGVDLGHAPGPSAS